MTIPASFKSPQWKEAHPKQIFGSQSSFIPPHQSKGNNPAPFKKSAKFDELFKPASSRAVYDDNDGSGDHSSPKNGSAFSLASGSILDKFLKNSKSVQVGPEPQLKVAESAMSQVVRSKSVKRSAVKSGKGCLNKSPLEYHGIGMPILAFDVQIFGCPCRS